MRNLFIRALFIISLVLPSIAYGCEHADGILKFTDLLQASTRIANSTPSTLVNKSIPGSIITINGNEYEIRFFSFENINGNLAVDTKFINYIKNSRLLEAKSTVSEPMSGLRFHVFDFRKYKLNDGVYFSMALRELKKR